MNSNNSIPFDKIIISPDLLTYTYSIIYFYIYICNLLNWGLIQNNKD